MTKKQRLCIVGGLIIFAVLGRLLLIDFANIETITAAALVGAAFLGKRYALFIPLIAVATTDAIIGNTSIMFFTWSAWAAVGLIGLILRKTTHSTTKFTLAATGTSIVAVLFFYIWTNFGVWLISGMYPPTFSGLIASYTMAIPFLKFHILGSLMVVPMTAYIGSSLILRLQTRTQKEESWKKQKQTATTD